MMKKDIFWVMSVLVAVIGLASCGGGLIPKNYGFPKKVTFGVEGGAKVVKGSKDLYAVGIRTYGGENKGTESDTLSSGYYAKRDWLKAEFNSRTGEMTIMADPNTSGKKRRLIVDGMVMNGVVDIVVHQGK